MNRYSPEILYVGTAVFKQGYLLDKVTFEKVLLLSPYLLIATYDED